MRKLWKENGLSIVVFALFLLSWGAQTAIGFHEYKEDQKMHHRPSEISMGEYLTSGHFIEATFENWESEFLQMGVFVILTSFLYQKGSAESKDPYKKDEDSSESKSKDPSKLPWPVRKGGLALRIYRHSLSLSFFALFLISFFMHAVGGAKEYTEELSDHGQSKEVSVVDYMETSRFWFESFQNWQSEFLAVGSVVVLSIFLREQGSAQSKDLEAPHSENA